MGCIARHLISAILVCTAFSTAGAQDSYIKPGATVRFKTDSSGPRYYGYLARLTSDSLFLESCDTCNGLFYSRAELNHFDVLHIKRRGDRFLGGFLIGALVGGGLGYIAFNNCREYDRCDLAGFDIYLGAIFGGLLGGGAGFISAYKWEPIPRDGS